MSTRDKKYTRHKGQSLVMFTGVLIVFVALAGLAIDANYATSMHRKLHNRSDQSAQAGAQEINIAILAPTKPLEGTTQSIDTYELDPQKAIKSACQFVNQNPDPDFPGVKCDPDNPNGNPSVQISVSEDNQTVTVLLSTVSPSFFMKVAGIPLSTHSYAHPARGLVNPAN